MVAITIRDVPEELRDALASQAECQGKSLQECLRFALEAEASLPTMDEFLDMVEERLTRTGTTLGVAEILAARDEARRG
jgi:hypothetical protein